MGPTLEQAESEAEQRGGALSRKGKVYFFEDDAHFLGVDDSGEVQWTGHPPAEATLRQARARLSNGSPMPMVNVWGVRMEIARWECFTEDEALSHLEDDRLQPLDAFYLIYRGKRPTIGYVAHDIRTLGILPCPPTTP